MIRYLSISTLFISLLFLSGCKHPDTVQLHPNVREDVGGDVKWHPYVEQHYSEFSDWAQGRTSSAAVSHSGDPAYTQENSY